MRNNFATLFSIEPVSLLGFHESLLHLKNLFLLFQTCCPKALHQYPSVFSSVVCISFQITCPNHFLYISINCFGGLLLVSSPLLSETAFFNSIIHLHKCRIVISQGPHIAFLNNSQLSFTFFMLKFFLPLYLAYNYFQFGETGPS